MLDLCKALARQRDPPKLALQTNVNILGITHMLALLIVVVLAHW